MATSSGLPRVGRPIQTVSGISFFPLDPLAAEVRLGDIAHALSMVCRWGGHCEEFFSVADHCVRVSKVCKPEDALAGLLHDAHEAYLIGDVVSPTKTNTFLRVGPELIHYEWVAKRLDKVIGERFSVQLDPLPESVIWADKVLAETERRDLMLDVNWWPHEDVEPLKSVIIPLSHHDARAAFIRRFAQLTSSRPEFIK